MLKFGFEREFFVTVPDPDAEDSKLVLPPGGMPRDGVLAEARGKPKSDPIDAAFSLLAEEHRMKTAFPGHELESLAVLAVSREMRIECARTEVKGLVHYQNLYGHKRHRNKVTEMTAGLHVSVTRGKALNSKTCRKCHNTKYHEVNIMFDFAQFVYMMDEEYKDIIKASSRRPGFYEIKDDGRVEYRSLPTNRELVMSLRMKISGVACIILGTVLAK